MRACALACVPVRPPPEGTLYVIAKGGRRDRASGLSSSGCAVRSQKGKMVQSI